MSQARDRCENKAQFKTLVHAQVGVGIRRAYSLIAIAEGRETLEQQRERNRAVNKAHRARKTASASRDAPPDQADLFQRAQQAVQALNPDELKQFIEWLFKWKKVGAAS